MHDLNVLMTFAGGLAGALALGYAAHRLTLSPIVGYLLAGVLVGPFTPGFVADRPTDPNRCILVGYGPVGSIVHGRRLASPPAWPAPRGCNI